MLPFMSFQEGPHQKIVLSRIFQNSAGKMANCIIVDIVFYLWQTVCNSFLIFTKIYSKDESLRRRKQQQESEDESGLGWIRGLRGKEQDMSSLALEWEPFF